MIKNSVGIKTKAKNNRDDVRTVQRAINMRMGLLVPLKKLTDDGKIGPSTLAAIDHVQSKLINKVDGVISPYKNTIKKLWPLKYANPTGKVIRGKDAFGSGHHGASRGARTHDGADYNSTPEQIVKAPISGKVTKISKPYSSGTDASILSGLEIEASDGTKCWIWYIQPTSGIVGKVVEAGKTKIGTAKTLKNRYSGITDHVHIRIHGRTGNKINPATVIK